MRIDLNADVGEAATAEGRATELAVLAFVSSVNIACGAHAGDAETMRRTIDGAAARALAIGAHPGYADRDGLGRRELILPPAAVTTLVLDQIQLLASIASASGFISSRAMFDGAASKGAKFGSSVKQSYIGVALASN